MLASITAETWVAGWFGHAAPGTRWGAVCFAKATAAAGQSHDGMSASLCRGLTSHPCCCCSRGCIRRSSVVSAVAPLQLRSLSSVFFGSRSPAPKTGSHDSKRKHRVLLIAFSLSQALCQPCHGPWCHELCQRLRCQPPTVLTEGAAGAAGARLAMTTGSGGSLSSRHMAK